MGFLDHKPITNIDRLIFNVNFNGAMMFSCCAGVVISFIVVNLFTLVLFASSILYYQGEMNYWLTALRQEQLRSK